MSLLITYLKQCRVLKLPEEISIKTFDFILENKRALSLLLHQPKLNALQSIRSNQNEPIENWRKVLSSVSLGGCDGLIFERGGYCFYLSGTDFESSPVYIFVVKSTDNDAVKDILLSWQSLIQFQQTILKCSNQKNQNEYGNLISQLLHDVHALTEVELKNGLQDELAEKIEYQKKINKNLLFYVRDFDLFKSEITVGKFLKDSLALINVNIDSLAVDVQDAEAELFVDVELFSEAFNHVVQNGLDAVAFDYSKLKIKIYTLVPNTPFIKDNWIVFDICDEGKGISEEFLPYVKNPFFTTQKYKNNTGFGLANAKKIIEGHNGYLEIKSDKGTQVKIFIPHIKNEEN
jgi:Histidine kinase-, DNA gyrase B-, and HSP90-like ATPase